MVKKSKILGESGTGEKKKLNWNKYPDDPEEKSRIEKQAEFDKQNKKQQQQPSTTTSIASPIIIQQSAPANPHATKGTVNLNKKKQRANERSKRGPRTKGKLYRYDKNGIIYNVNEQYQQQSNILATPAASKNTIVKITQKPKASTSFGSVFTNKNRQNLLNIQKRSDDKTSEYLQGIRNASIKNVNLEQLGKIQSQQQKQQQQSNILETPVASKNTIPITLSTNIGKKQNLEPAKEISRIISELGIPNLNIINIQNNLVNFLEKYKNGSIDFYNDKFGLGLSNVTDEIRDNLSLIIYKNIIGYYHKKEIMTERLKVLSELPTNNPEQLIKRVLKIVTVNEQRKPTRNPTSNPTSNAPSKKKPFLTNNELKSNSQYILNKIISTIIADKNKQSYKKFQISGNSVRLLSTINNIVLIFAIKKIGNNFMLTLTIESQFLKNVFTNNRLELLSINLSNTNNQNRLSKYVTNIFKPNFFYTVDFIKIALIKLFGYIPINLYNDSINFNISINNNISKKFRIEFDKDKDRYLLYLKDSNLPVIPKKLPTILTLPTIPTTLLDNLPLPAIPTKSLKQLIENINNIDKLINKHKDNISKTTKIQKIIIDKIVDKSVDKSNTNIIKNIKHIPIYDWDLFIYNYYIDLIGDITIRITIGIDIKSILTKKTIQLKIDDPNNIIQLFYNDNKNQYTFNINHIPTREPYDFDISKFSIFGGDLNKIISIFKFIFENLKQLYNKGFFKNNTFVQPTNKVVSPTNKVVSPTNKGSLKNNKN